MEPFQGSPSCSATEADLVGVVRLAGRASGVRAVLFICVKGEA